MCDFFNAVLRLFRVPETKAAVDQSDAAMLKKKLKKKRRRRLKEVEEGQWCSDGHNGNTDPDEPSSKKSAIANGKESNRGTGARFCW